MTSALLNISKVHWHCNVNVTSRTKHLTFQYISLEPCPTYLLLPYLLSVTYYTLHITSPHHVHYYELCLQFFPAQHLYFLTPPNAHTLAMRHPAWFLIPFTFTTLRCEAHPSSYRYCLMWHIILVITFVISPSAQINQLILSPPMNLHGA